MRGQQSPINQMVQTIVGKRFSRKELILVGTGILVAVAFIVGRIFLLSRQQTKNLEVVQLTVPPVGAASGGPEQNETVSEPLSTVPQRDPFLPDGNEIVTPVIPEAPKPKKPEILLEVSGILWDEQVPSAIINSKILKIGDIIGGKTVVDIEKDRVFVMEDGELQMLPLYTGPGTE